MERSAKSITENCEIILCEDATRRDKGCLFIELTAEELADLHRELIERAVSTVRRFLLNSPFFDQAFGCHHYVRVFASR